MSFINKTKSQKVPYNELLSILNTQHEHVVALEEENKRLRDKMSRMSDVPILRDKLDNLNQRWLRMQEVSPTYAV